jgi:hypothetical protein
VPVSRQRVTAAYVARLDGSLSDRDRAVIGSLDRVRVATAGQLRRLHFTRGSARANARQCQRRLRALVERQVLSELDRRVGGPGGGSAQTVLALDRAGQLLASGCGPAGGRRRRRPWTPSALYLGHALDVTELYVRMCEWEHAGGGELVAFDAEPACWRRFTGPAGARAVLKPDAFVRTAAGELEHFAFVEVDRATASLPAISRKLAIYASFRRAGGHEQRRFGVFPRVLLLAPNAARRDALAEVAAGAPSAIRDATTAACFDDALDALTGGAG